MHTEYEDLKSLIFASIVSLIVTIISGLIVIPILKRLRAGQTILHYVKEHENKNGTPTMGGLFFIVPVCIVFLFFGGYKGRIATVSLGIGLAYLIVGFLDDFIKIKYRKNEGLKAYQKIIFQLGVAIIASIFAYSSGLTSVYLPFVNYELELGVFVIPLVIIIFLAITNSVNLTDGLDGLAGQVSCTYLVFLIALVYLQCEKFSILHVKMLEINKLMLLASCLVGGVLGFLCFNVSKAKVFMGDTGSLSLGGFIGSISIFSLNSLFIPLIGIMFVTSSISVIVQVLYYKKTKKRVFLMAPYHHHLQLKGYSETQISFYYFIITAVFGVISIISYL